MKDLPPRRTVVTVCRSGHRSDVAARMPAREVISPPGTKSTEVAAHAGSAGDGRCGGPGHGICSSARPTVLPFDVQVRSGRTDAPAKRMAARGRGRIGRLV